MGERSGGKRDSFMVCHGRSNQLLFLGGAESKQLTGKNKTKHKKKPEGREKQCLPRQKQAKAVIERLSQYECERGFVSKKNTAGYI